MGCPKVLMGDQDILMCRHPAMRAPLRGCSPAYLRRVAIRPGILSSQVSMY